MTLSQVAVVPPSATSVPSPPVDALAILQQPASEVPFNLDMCTQGQALNLAHTMNGVTVTLLWGYRDADRVVVAYTVHSAQGLRPVPRTDLTSATGTRFRPGGGYAVSAPVPDVPVPPGYGAFLADFHSEVPRDATTTVPLRFEVTVIEEAPRALDADAPPATVTASGDTVVQAQPLPVAARTGPFTFEVTLPAR